MASCSARGRTGGFILLQFATSTRVGNRSSRYWVIATYSNSPIGASGSKIDHDVDVARKLCLAACGRAEQGNVQHSALAELQFMRA